MTYLENLLATVFSGDVGLSDEGVKSALQAIRANPDRRELHGIREDFQALMDSDNPDWIRLLENEKYEVVLFDDQYKAKEFLFENVWDPLFGE